MSINNYNVGRDVSIVFSTAKGPLALAIVTDFHSRQLTKKQESHGIDGVVRFQYIPGGWEGDITIDRANRALDDIIFQKEQLYYGGLNVPADAITETITEADGTVSQWRYEGVMFCLPDHGNWKGDSKVSQKLEFSASFRKQVQ